MNGSRVAEWICRLVPNFPVFATALRFVKHWARQRGLYSNVLGFLGGVNYAILVAFVCQKYPHVSAGTVVHKFFQTFFQWPWPQPVMLVPVVEDHDPESDHAYLPVWNPKVYPKDGLQIMPIITPAYPAMNSSYNVGLPQYRLIQSEIIRGLQMFQAHKKENSTNKSSIPKAFPWRTLCSPAVTDFFSRHPIYIQVDISAYSADDHRSWFGWCESRLRLLILSLEQPPTTFCHPQANCFHRRLQLPNRAPLPPTSLGVISSPGGGSGLASSGTVRRSLSDGDLADRQMGHGHGMGYHPQPLGLSSHNHHQGPNNYHTNQGSSLSSRPGPMFQSNINMSDASTSTSTSPSISPNNIADPADEADVIADGLVAPNDPYVETTTSGSGSDIDACCCSSSDGTSTRASTTTTNTNTEDTLPSHQHHSTAAAVAIHTQSSTSIESKHGGGNSSGGETSDEGSTGNTVAPSTTTTTTTTTTAMGSATIGNNTGLLSPSSSSSIAGTNGPYVTVAVGHISTFFIGLSFMSNLRGPVNVTYAINDFIHRVQCWDGRTSSMGIEVHLRRQSEVPDFVYETKAEPSSMHACTPAKTNKNVGGDEVEIGECHQHVVNRRGGGSDEVVSGVNTIGDDDCDRSHYHDNEGNLDEAVSNSTTISTHVDNGSILAEDLASDDPGDLRGRKLRDQVPSTGTLVNHSTGIVEYPWMHI